MKMRFIGQYTNGRTTITYGGVTFTGHDATVVTEKVAEMLKNNPEFEAVADAPSKKPAAKKKAKKK